MFHRRDSETCGDAGRVSPPLLLPKVSATGRWILKATAAGRQEVPLKPVLINLLNQQQIASMRFTSSPNESVKEEVVHSDTTRIFSLTPPNTLT